MARAETTTAIESNSTLKRRFEEEVSDLASAIKRHQGGSHFHDATSTGDHTYGASTIGGAANVHMGNVYGGIYHVYRDAMLPDRTDHEKLVAIKAALYYSAMDDRRDQLAQINAASLDWLWTETGFTNWLGTSGQIFWISGKPGSGKSTLMHFLVGTNEGCERIRQCLPVSESPWLLLQFSFGFRARTGVANSSARMLRSFLLQLMQKVSEVKELNLLVHLRGGLDHETPLGLNKVFSERPRD